MSETVRILLMIIIPMAAVQAICILADRRFSFTAKLTERHSFFKRHKYLWQIGGDLAVILILGIALLIAGVSQNVYFIAAAAAVGFIHGMAACVMNSDEEQ